MDFLDQERSSYGIRPAVVDDAQAIAHVHIESWKTTYAGILPEAVLETPSLEKRADMWRGILAAAEQSSVTLVACDSAGGVVGFVHGGKERSGQLGCDGELYAIYLLQSVQRQGVGRRLVGKFGREMVAKGFTSMAVWVLDRNPSRRFYEVLGGTVIGQKSMEFGGRSYLEVAFGWEALDGVVMAFR
jgi:GNAT superfamily N-acetyltransferase